MTTMEAHDPARSAGDATPSTAGGGITESQRAEIAEARAQTSQTRRATVPALEEILYEPLPVLDHGFVRVVDY
ncbi:MAG: hypothetical protein Q8M79_07395, partial [Dehalococcoidia bacterium]|nr:hypothetical protein [Dehalococcoidia bacterium]